LGWLDCQMGVIDNMNKIKKIEKKLPKLYGLIVYNRQCIRHALWWNRFAWDSVYQLGVK